MVLLLAACDPLNYVIDGHYGTDGVANVNTSYAGVVANDVAFLPDQSIDVATLSGTDSVLLHIDPDGKVDSAFSANVAPMAEEILGLTVDGSNRIVTTHEDSSEHLLVRRRLTNGQLDTTFGTGGTVSLPSILQSTSVNVAVDHAGRILIAYIVGTETAPYFGCVVTRLLSDGQVDGAFGKGATDLPPSVPAPGTVPAQTCALRLLVRSDDSLAVVGQNGLDVLDSTGKHISGYGSDAEAFFSSNGFIAAAALLPGDALALGATRYDGGLIGQRFAVARLTANGHFDPNFGSAGTAVVGFKDLKHECVSGDNVNDDVLTWVSGTPTGNILALGGNCEGLDIARWTNGHLDTTLNGDGRELIPSDTLNPERDLTDPHAAVVAPDGSVLLVAPTNVALAPLTVLHLVGGPPSR
jgi:hypothetical protein